jgi:hypothetical protein
LNELLKDILDNTETWKDKFTQWLNNLK